MVLSTLALLALGAQIASAKPAPAIYGLNHYASKHGRYFGTATDQLWNNTDTKYLAIAGDTSEFGIQTPSNAMKWESTEPSRNSFNFEHADFMYKWFTKHGQRARGHCLVWHSQLPSWVSSGGFDKNSLISIIQNHIAHVAGHYRGKLYAWDVLNEALNEDGTYRSTVFYDTIGPDYIPIAFKAAFAADPHAKLYYNDYNIEGVNAKSDALYKIVKSLRAHRVPIHGVGLQGHLVIGTVPTDIPANIKRFADLGVEVAVTELDIRGNTPLSDADVAQQIKDYTTVINACTSVSRCVGLTTWDVSDDYSWIPGFFSGEGEALLWDSNKDPKKAYYASVEALSKAKVKGIFPH
jgi:endo-1,4-beta-xylanase